MEGLLLIAAYLKIQSFMQIATEMKPFLNIHDEDILYYRIVILLKMVFAIISMKELFSKRIITFLLVAGNAYLYLMNSAASLPLSISWIPLFIFMTPFNGKYPVFPIAVMFAVAVNIKPYEFLLDMYVLICIAVYAIEAYKWETQKLSTLILFILSLSWYMCIDTNNCDIVSIILILLVLVLVYHPLLPEKSKFRHRLLYIYALVFAWILYSAYETCHCFQNTETVANMSQNINECLLQNETMTLPDKEVCSTTETVYDDPHYLKLVAESKQLDSLAKRIVAQSKRITSAMRPPPKVADKNDLSDEEWENLVVYYDA